MYCRSPFGFFYVDHSLSNSGELYGYGRNSNGELGIGNKNSPVTNPSPSLIQGVKSFVCGYSLSVAQLKDDKIFVWGEFIGDPVGEKKPLILCKKNIFGIYKFINRDNRFEKHFSETPLWKRGKGMASR